MANTQAQFGFQHYGYLPGGAADYQLSKYAVQSSFATRIFFGDPVIKSAASQYIRPATASTGGTAISGIFYGAQYNPPGGTPAWTPWWPGSQGSDAIAYCIDAPNALFKVAALLTAVPATAMGANIGFSTGAGGTTVGGGFSTYTVDQASITTAGTAQFRLINFFPGVGNGSDTTTSFNWVIVGFNQQAYQIGTGVA